MTTRFVTALTAAPVLLAAISSPGKAAELKPADRAWIEQCVAARTGNANTTSARRAYCTCMHDVVEDNQPFGVTELERTYPPVHMFCWKKARMRPG